MRRQSKQVFAGKVAIGGGAPISVQSMLNVPASDIEGNVRQAVELERAGCEILRVSIPDQTAVALIPAIKQAVRIPVLANGDVTTAEGALDLLAKTGCDGVMIGRGALGDPWLFDRVRAALLGEESPAEPTLNQRMMALRRQIYEMCEEKGEWLAMPQARSQAMHYMKGLRGAASLRRYCSMLEHFTDVDKLIDAVYRLQD